MKSTIKELLLKHGFIIKPGETDLKPYVYAAAEALIKYGQQSVVQANVALMIKEQEESQMAFYKATLRQHTATQCMQGLLAYSGERFTSPDQVASLAIECADALIAKLDKDQAK